VGVAREFGPVARGRGRAELRHHLGRVLAERPRDVHDERRGLVGRQPEGREVEGRGARLDRHDHLLGAAAAAGSRTFGDAGGVSSSEPSRIGRREVVMPAPTHRSRSPAMADAVSAMIGTPPVPASWARIVVAAS
jgi:hypothetical protein